MSNAEKVADVVHPKIVERIADIYVDKYVKLGFDAAKAYADIIILPSASKELQEAVRQKVISHLVTRFGVPPNAPTS